MLIAPGTKARLLATLMLTSLSLSAVRGGEEGFRHWDSNKDGSISREEFLTGNSGWFDGWDVNRDGRLERSEFQAWQGADFDVWDLDRDGYLNKKEYRSGVFGMLDASGDHQLDRPEWEAAGEEGWFNAPETLPEQASHESEPAVPRRR